MPADLTDDRQFKEVLLTINPSEEAPGWINDLEAFLSYVDGADLEERKTKVFHEKIWEDNPVSGVGMGTVNISAAIDDAEFRAWVAAESLTPLPKDIDARIAHLQSFYNQLVNRLKTFSSRTPRVKIFRALAALYPTQFTSIADAVRLVECHRAWFRERKKPNTIVCHWNLISRINKLLGPSDGSFRAIAERMATPWLIYESQHLSRLPEMEVAETTPQGQIELKPFPAAQRRKGFTSIKGGLETIASSLSFVLDGVSRQDLMDYLRTEFPDHRESSLRTLINILKNEFYVVQEKDGLITPTTRGEIFLETGDTQDLIPLFLTRTLGVDHVLLALLKGSSTKGELVSLLKQVNPGWTSDFAPSSMLRWLRDFDLLGVEGMGNYYLTDAGKSWAELIHWEPEFLPARDSEEDEVEVSPGASALSPFAIDHNTLLSKVTADTAFPSSLVSQLHFGLWGHERRHFAIMAGLSGSGKTFLAKRYSEVLACQFSETPTRNVFIQVVQPGWYDPAPLFGYINPLVPDNYIRPPFLDFLLNAVNHPDQAFFVILDEMNLSHPEQYFAPVLSAMETGGLLRLHNEGKIFDGVPDSIPYPSNVAFIGTINMDETTHGISDKVLDRAFTLEFWDINLDDYPKWESFGLASSHVTGVRGCLDSLLSVLAPVRLHFGWRTVDDVLSYIAVASKVDGFDLKVALDDVIYARVLPKLRGTENGRILEALDKTIKVLEEHSLARCCAKVRNLKSDLNDTGMMRFWR